MAGVYYLAGRIGLELAYLDGAVAALWPPAGLRPRRPLPLRDPAVAGDRRSATCCSATSRRRSAPCSPRRSATRSPLVVAALLLRRLTGGRGELERVADVLALVACALVAALISAAFGPLALRLGDVIPADELGRVFRTWTLSDACRRARGRAGDPHLGEPRAAGHPPARGRRGRDRARAAGGAGRAAAAARRPLHRFPVLLWAALRFGPRGASTAILVVCSITVWNTAHNAGPFVRESTTDSLLATQLFIATAALTSLVLAAVTAERTHVAAALAESEASQRALADEQAALRRVATLVAGGAPPSRVFEQVTEEVARLLGMPGASLVRYDGDAHGDGRRRLERRRQAAPARRRSTFDLDGDTVVGEGAAHAASPQRVERYADARGDLAETLRAPGYRAAVAAPVTVAGRLWGALAAGTRSDEPLPEGARTAAVRLRRAGRPGAGERRRARAARRVARADRRGRRRRAPAARAQPARRRAAAARLASRSTCGWSARRSRRTRAAARRTLAAAQEQLAQGLDELRELARGIHPAVLTERGLGPALEALLARAPVPVEITELPEERLAGPVEAAAYYVVAEAITNVAKYAQASHVTVSIRRTNGRATVTSPTTASAARTPPAARACAGWQTGSRRSTAASRSTARPRAAPASAPRSPARDRTTERG